METRLELENLITRKLRARGLVRIPGKLAFLHRGQEVALDIDQTIYRGFFISVLDAQRKVREFRASSGDFDWEAIARSVIDVAEARLSPKRTGEPVNTVAARNRQLAIDLTTMIANGATSHLSIEPSPASPGRLRVKLRELDLDPAAVLQLCATLSRALAPAADKGDHLSQYAAA